MDTFKLNKIAGAVLGTLTVLLGVNVVVDEIFSEEKPHASAHQTAGKPGEGHAPAAAGVGVAALLAKADPAKGEAAVKKCAACHSFDKGGEAKAGPNLYGVVGAKHGHMEGFGYSDAMKKTADKVWDFANLNTWLENPKAYIDGTTMAFAGVKDAAERANILAYLNKNSDTPQPLPAADAAAGEAKPAEGPKSAEAAAPAAAPEAAGGDGGEVAAKVAAADPAKGEVVAKKCAACHSFEKGGPAKVGPNLYGIVGAKHAHAEGFEYSEGMQKTAGKIWDVAALDKWLENPKAYIDGTSMAFAGVKSADDRAALIAYLNKNSDNPAPLPGK